MAKVLSPAHPIAVPGRTSPYIQYRAARAPPPRRFRANRLNPGIKSYWRWGWFRGVAAVDRGDHGTSYIRVCIGHKWGYTRIYGGKNGHICAYLWAMYAHIYGSSNGHVCAYLWQQEWPCIRISMAAAMAMYAHIYGSSSGHVCAYLWQQQWPCMRISMAAVVAMSNGHVCAYLWQQQWPCMRISMGHVCAYLWQQ